MSEKPHFKNELKKLYHLFVLLFSLLGIIMTGLVYYMVDPNFAAFKDQNIYIGNSQEIEDDRIENGIHVRTGLKDAEGLMTVVNNCTNCHSAKLVTQNRMSAERWDATIRWMQETQNLWELGPNQKIIVDYLVENYPPEEVGRRAQLAKVEWYELEE